MDSPKKWPCVIYVIGSPGSGKGTICKKLEADFKCSYVSLGDLLRSLSTHPGAEHAEVAEYVCRGILVPTDSLFRVLENVASAGPTKDRQVLLIDGFPRRLDQGMDIERLGFAPDLVLFFDCRKEIAKERFLTRKIEGRLLDDETLFETRHKEFERRNPAIVTYYSCLHKLIEVNSEGETEVTYKKVLDALGARMEWAEAQFSGMGV